MRNFFKIFKKKEKKKHLAYYPSQPLKNFPMRAVIMGKERYGFPDEVCVVFINGKVVCLSEIYVYDEYIRLTVSQYQYDTHEEVTVAPFGIRCYCWYIRIYDGYFIAELCPVINSDYTNKSNWHEVKHPYNGGVSFNIIDDL